MKPLKSGINKMHGQTKIIVWYFCFLFGLFNTIFHFMNMHLITFFCFCFCFLSVLGPNKNLDFGRTLIQSYPLSICAWFFKISTSRNWFLTWFLSISHLIFTACVACKNQVWNRQKIKFKNQFYEVEILKNQVQIDKGLV